jgi:methionine synthase I (cobalamin-dependent)
VDAIPIIKEFAEQTDLPLVFKPNAGKPVLAEDGSVISPYSAENFANDVAPVLDLVTYLGGCCGSSPDYIRTLRDQLNS